MGRFSFRSVTILGLFGLLLVLILSTGAPPIAESQAATNPTFTPWPEFQGDPANSGRSTVRGISRAPVLLWKRRLTDMSGYLGDALVMSADGRVYGTAGGGLYALQAPEGALRWTLRDYGFATTAAPVIAPNGMLYWGVGDALLVISADGVIEASASPLTSNLIFNGSATIGSDGTVYAVHDALWAFQPSGEPAWVVPFGDFVHTDLAIGPDGTIYTTVSAGLAAFNPDGSLRWQAAAGGKSDSPSVAPDGTIYVGDELGRVRAITAAGVIAWTYQVDALASGLSGGVTAPPTIAADGTIYVGNAAALDQGFPSAYLYALRPDGTLKWKYRIPGRGGDGKTGFHTPVVLDRDGNIYGCALNGSCYSWAPDGRLRWEYVAVAGRWNQTTPLLVSDGLIWILDATGEIHALADPDRPLLQAEPAALAATPCVGAAPFTLDLTVAIGATDANWQATITPEVPWATLTEFRGTGRGTARLQIAAGQLAAGRYQTAIRLSTDSPSVANQAHLVPLEVAVGCPIYLPALGQ